MLLRTILLALFLASLPACAARAADAPPVTFLARGNGGRVDWGPNNVIAFDRQNKDGWFDVWTMNPDGAMQRCLTCRPGMPTQHKGNPAWHPSGKYIVFQALDDRIKIPWLIGKLYRLFTNPGAGVNNNVWIMTADGSQAWQITDVGKGHGVLHPHFSHDGKTLVWAEMIDTRPGPFGTWVVKKGAFRVVDGRPVVGFVETLRPGGLQFYETHGFTPGDGGIIFTGMPEGGTSRDLDIYTYAFGSGKLNILTPRALGAWDEHASFSPDGSRILWMSSMGATSKAKGAFVPTDWWMMNADGTGKRRVTRFNVNDSPQFMPGRIICADSSWSPDGKRFAGYVEDNATATKAGDIVVVTPEEDGK